MYEFDRDTAVARRSEHSWTVEVTPRWNVGTIPNGGYLMAIALNAVAQDLPHPDPLTATSHFLGRVASDHPAVVEVEVLRTGRTLSTACARLTQDGRERMRMLATFGDLAASSGPTHITAQRPVIPAPDDCVGTSDGYATLEIQKRFDLRFTPDTVGGALGQPTGDPRVSGWIRFADGRPPDLRSLALFVDAFPPTALNLDRFGWVPTIELTVHFRARPAPGWLQAAFTSRFLVESHMEEDGEIWDTDGNLVALSRQLSRILVKE